MRNAEWCHIRDDQKRDVAQKFPAGKSPTGISSSQPRLSLAVLPRAWDEPASQHSEFPSILPWISLARLPQVTHSRFSSLTNAVALVKSKN